MTRHQPWSAIRCAFAMAESVKPEPPSVVPAVALAGTVKPPAYVFTPWQMFIAVPVSGLGWAVTAAALVTGLP